MPRGEHLDPAVAAPPGERFLQRRRAQPMLIKPTRCAVRRRFHNRHTRGNVRQGVQEREHRFLCALFPVVGEMRGFRDVQYLNGSRAARARILRRVAVDPAPEPFVAHQNRRGRRRLPLVRPRKIVVLAVPASHGEKVVRIFITIGDLHRPRRKPAAMVIDHRRAHRGTPLLARLQGKDAARRSMRHAPFVDLKNAELIEVGIGRHQALVFGENFAARGKPKRRAGGNGRHGHRLLGGPRFSMVGFPGGPNTATRAVL